MSGQMCLIVEACVGGDLSRGVTLQQTMPGEIESPAEQVAVWRDPVAAGERADQVCCADAESSGHGSDPFGAGRVGVEHLPGASRGAGGGWSHRRRPPREMPAQTFHDYGQSGLGREIVAARQVVIEA